MQPSVKGEEVECVYLYRNEGERRDEEIWQLGEGLTHLLGQFPRMGEKYERWRAHNKARVAAGLEPEELPANLYHYDNIARLKERTWEQHQDNDNGAQDAVAVTPAEIISMDILLRMHTGSSAEPVPGARFLLSVCQVFEAEVNMAGGGQ